MGQSQQPSIISTNHAFSPLGSSSSRDLHQAKKRGRPSKADVIRRQEESIATGEILPAVEPQPPVENGSRATEVAAQIQTPSSTSLKRNRTLTGDAEDDRRIRPWPFSQPVEKVPSSNIFELLEPNDTRTTSHPEKALLPLQHLSPINPGSPLRNLTLASGIEASASPKNQPSLDSDRAKKLRVRCPTIS
jgi:hypothetical protein